MGMCGVSVCRSACFVIQFRNMKKILLVLAVLMYSLPMTAQVFVGGNVGFDYSTYSRKEGFDPMLPQGMALRISPQVGYAFSPGLKAGVVLTFANQKYTYSDGFFDTRREQWSKNRQTERNLMTVGGGLFVRMGFIDYRDFTLGVEVAASYAFGFGTIRDTQYYSTDNFPVLFESKAHTRQIEAKVTPVASYRLSDHFAADVYFDVLSVILTHSIEDRYKTREVYWWSTDDEPVLDNTTSTTNLHLGVNSLTSRLVSIGFSYAF